MTVPGTIRLDTSRVAQRRKSRAQASFGITLALASLYRARVCSCRAETPLVLVSNHVSEYTGLDTGDVLYLQRMECI
jgi:hypothetical protein